MATSQGGLRRTTSRARASKTLRSSALKAGCDTKNWRWISTGESHWSAESFGLDVLRWCVLIRVYCLGSIQSIHDLSQFEAWSGQVWPSSSGHLSGALNSDFAVIGQRPWLVPVVRAAPAPGSTRTRFRQDPRTGIIDMHRWHLEQPRLLQYALPLEELNGADKVRMKEYLDVGEERNAAEICNFQLENLEICLKDMLEAVYDPYCCVPLKLRVSNWIWLTLIHILSCSEPHAAVVPGTPAGTLGCSWFGQLPHVSPRRCTPWSCVKVCSAFPGSNNAQQSYASGQHIQWQFQSAWRSGRAKHWACQFACTSKRSFNKIGNSTWSHGHHQPVCFRFGGSLGSLLCLGWKCGLAQRKSIRWVEANRRTRKPRS